MRQAFMSNHRYVVTKPKDMTLRANVEPRNPGARRRR
jgi:hypothetical protein